MAINIHGILCCPECKGDVNFGCAVATPSGRLKSAVIYCHSCDDVVGVIRNFKADFLHFDKPDARRKYLDGLLKGGSPVTLPWEVVDESILPHDPRLHWFGRWERWTDGSRMSWGRDGDRVFFSGEFTDVGVRLLKHPWSGFVKFILDGVNVGEVDLYNADESKVHWVPIAHDLSPGTHTLEIVSSSKQNPQSQARQIFFHELVVSRPRQKSFMEEEREDINRVLPLFPSVLELMRETPKDGLILDCGSGDRVFRDPRYVSVDCQQYQLPLVYADVLKLPFRNGTFDCVISQALLEHVPDPFAAVREMVRVTKPGGKLWSGMAFMQPLHAIPSHYFNATPWGIQELFRSVEILELKWFGELSFTIDWLLKAAGIAGRLPEVRYQALIEQIKSFDAMVSYEALRAVASGVSVLARKPV